MREQMLRIAIEWLDDQIIPQSKPLSHRLSSISFFGSRRGSKRPRRPRFSFGVLGVSEAGQFDRVNHDDSAKGKLRYADK